MNNVQKYISQARKSNGRQLNFTGSRMNYAQQPGFPMNATGPAGPSAPVKKSMPYAVTVSSASGSAVSDFDVLGSYEYINNSGMSAAGSLVIGSITISSAIQGVSYRDLLYQAQNNPFTVGQTYLSCSNVTAQVMENFTIITKDANGIQVRIPIVPAIDPYQQQSSVLVVDQEYSIDGFTKLTFANILPNAVLTIRFYPSANVNPARSLDNSATTKEYGNPNIIRQ